MKTYPIEFYKRFFNWRWRVKANNGKTIGSSSEGFRNKKDCINNAKLLGLCLTAKDNI